MGRPAIEVEGLSKRYELGHGRARIQRLSEVAYEALRRPARRRRPQTPATDFYALRDVSLSIEEGEVIGFVGRNGAGKSTLLKILARITEPTSGSARLRGRVGALLEVGTGFHPELSGRENIYLNGAVLGMTRREIGRRFDEIVEFSEVERFLDTPVKRYSSGMHVRLAFAVAAHLEPDILLVDEVLAVGDTAFQRKCLGKMNDVAGAGRTVLFVSHNMTTLQTLCQRAYLLEAGRLIAEGPARDVVRRYLHVVSQATETPLSAREDRRGDGSVRMTDVTVENLDSSQAIAVGSRIRIRLRYQADRPPRGMRVSIAIYDITRAGIYRLDSEVRQGLPVELPAEGEIVCTTDRLLATPGRCYMNITIWKTATVADFLDNAAQFDIEEADPFELGRLPPRELAMQVIDQSWGAHPLDGAAVGAVEARAADPA